MRAPDRLALPFVAFDKRPDRRCRAALRRCSRARHRGRHVERRQPDRRARRPGHRPGHDRTPAPTCSSPTSPARPWPASTIAQYLDIPVDPVGAGELVVFCGAIVGAGLGFLWYNTYPAQVFMGDVGALALGGAIGFVALVTKTELPCRSSAASSSSRRCRSSSRSAPSR